MPSPRRVIHLLPNAHLDPVWLWDWREGLNEGIITVRTILDLMDEEPELTFMRGEAAIYEHIERTDPATFARLRRMVDAGRWDIVGGTYIQPDSNLPAAETLCRQFERGLGYFESRFGRRPTVAWQADSFGHTPGWPNILRAFGMDGFAFTRPQRSEFPMDEAAFWWATGYGDRVLCYRQHWLWYCSERANLPRTLDVTLAGAQGQPLTHAALLMGLGNHGGGPSRRHIEEARRWAVEHPECEVRFSTLHGFFEALRGEVSGDTTAVQVPTVGGDLGYCLRGCYSSVARFKSLYRRAEALLSGAETTQAAVAAGLGLEPLPLDEAWDAILFNSFHDILPGSSIERIYDDQTAWVGLAAHRALVARSRALNALATEADTSVPSADAPDRPTDVSLLVWNPLPHAVRGWFELEANMDYRPAAGVSFTVGSLPLSLIGPDGLTPRFQEIPVEHTSMQNAAWRKRVAVYDELPALGWKVYRYGTRAQTPDAPTPATPCTASPGPEAAITNPEWRVAVTPDGGITATHRGRAIFGGTGGLRVELLEDPWGSWGGMREERASLLLDQVREHWRVVRAEPLNAGPWRASLWTRWEGQRSWLELTFTVAADAPGVHIKGRLLMNERSARLKLMLPCAGALTMATPAAEATRDTDGPLPAGRWIARGEGAARVGFVSDVLGDVDATADELGVTLARATRYADDVPIGPDVQPWLPAVDCGELKFEGWLTAGPDADLELLAAQLLHPPVATLVPPHPGPRGQQGSLGEISPGTIRLLAAQIKAPGTLELRVQNAGSAPTHATWSAGGQAPVDLGVIRPWEIVTANVPTRTLAP